MIRNTPLLAILLIFLILNVFYFTPRVPKPDHVYNPFKYAFSGEEKDRDNAGSSFFDDLNNAVGLGNTDNLGAGGAGAGDKPLQNLNVQEQQGNLQDEVITLQNVAESLDVKQAGLGKAIGEQTPPPASASAQAKLTPNNDDDPKRIEADKSKLEQPLKAQSEVSTPEDSAQHPTDENASKDADADANLPNTPSSATPSAPAAEAEAAAPAPAEAEKQLESSPKAEIAPSRALNEDTTSATTVPGMDGMMRVRKP